MCATNHEGGLTSPNMVDAPASGEDPTSSVSSDPLQVDEQGTHLMF